MSLVFVMLIPLLATGVAFAVWREITWKEALLQLGSCLLLLFVSWQIAKWAGLSDCQNLNGRITEKTHGTQKCCHCWTVCDAHDRYGRCTSSHEECSHSVDYWWGLHSTVGSFSIERCNGWNVEPAAWTAAYVGEPASVDDTYENYLLADPESLFVTHSAKKYLDAVPGYPRPYGYYSLMHAISDGSVTVPSQWVSELAEINADLGASNQVDVTVLLTSRQDPAYAQSVEQKWLYGPKNSLTIVAGVADGSIKWVRIVTFSRVEELKVKLRDELQGKRLDDPTITPTIRKLVQHGFRRTPMAEFEYLARAAEPSGWALAIIIFLQLAVSVGLTILMHKENIFNERSTQ